MKFTVTFKNPDAVSSSLQDYPEDQREEMEEFANKFLAFGEYVDIEFDTEKGTAKVVKP